MIKVVSRTTGTILDTQEGFWHAQNTVYIIFTTSQEKHRKIIEQQSLSTQTEAEYCCL